jgi:class 3 adenylate cyclase
MAELTETLASYVPTLVTRRLTTNPRPINEPSAESFPTAVLFADVSGFTPLTERLAQRGPAGAETLTHELNTYFGQLIEIVTACGGDVVKFAGDALTAIWPVVEAHENGLSMAMRRAAACALAIQTALKNYQTVDGLKLSLKIGLGAGEMTVIHVGGIYSRWEVVLTGAPLGQVSHAEAQAQPGQTILSPEAWQRLEPHGLGQPC